MQRPKQYGREKFNIVTDILIATIVSADPISLAFQQDLRLDPDSETIVIPEHLKEYTYTLTIGQDSYDIPVREGLKQGDTVSVVCYNGYNNFYIQGRL